MISLPDNQMLSPDRFESVVVLFAPPHRLAFDVVSNGLELVYRGSLRLSPTNVVYELHDGDGNYLRTFDPRLGWSHQ